MSHTSKYRHTPLQAHELTCHTPHKGSRTHASHGGKAGQNNKDMGAMQALPLNIFFLNLLSNYIHQTLQRQGMLLE
jgi:hypothetical protein